MSASAHDRRIDQVMARQFRREGHTFAPAAEATPLDALIRSEEEQAQNEPDVYAIKRQAVQSFVKWVLYNGRLGPHPRLAMLRFFAYVRHVFPSELLNMSQSDLALLLNQTRATQSALEKRLFGELKRRGGYRVAVRMPGQKSLEACRKYAVRAKGNHHRRDSVAAAA
jgi:hypothetical protein